jgi:hypothetical protein
MIKMKTTLVSRIHYCQPVLRMKCYYDYINIGGKGPLRIQQEGSNKMRVCMIEIHTLDAESDLQALADNLSLLCGAGNFGKICSSCTQMKCNTQNEE